MKKHHDDRLGVATLEGKPVERGGRRTSYYFRLDRGLRLTDFPYEFVGRIRVDLMSDGCLVYVPARNFDDVDKLNDDNWKRYMPTVFGYDHSVEQVVSRLGFYVAAIDEASGKPGDDRMVAQAAGVPADGEGGLTDEERKVAAMCVGLWEAFSKLHGKGDSNVSRLLQDSLCATWKWVQGRELKRLFPDFWK